MFVRTPLAVVTRHSVISVAVGRSHCLILSSDGVLMACGNGKSGRLGLGDEENRNVPTPIAALIDHGKVVACAAGQWSI